MKLSNEVFERDGDSTLVANVFYGLIGLFLVYGLAGTAIVAHKLAIIHYMPGIVEYIFLGLAIPIAGVFLAMKSDNPILSFIGYNMILVPFGAILAPVINHYRPDIIERAFTLTCGTTLIMMLLGVLFPKLFSSLGSALFFSLLGLLFVRIAQIFLPVLNAMTWIDYVAAGIFSLYIGYDLWRARVAPMTVDSAIDIAVSLYLDIINLFLTILRIVGKK